MVRWDGTGHLAWNVIAIAVAVLGVVAVVSVPTERFRNGWGTKVWAILGTAGAVYFSGFYLPIGAVLGFAVARRLRRTPVKTG